MKKRRKQITRAPKDPVPKRLPVVIAGILCVFGLAGGLWWKNSRSAGTRSAPTTSQLVAAPTFNRDIAPIVFRNCSSCHRPGRAGPFSLLIYADAKKHAKQIAEVTGRRFMPPWLAEDVGVKYLGERRLSDAEIGNISGWVEQGSVEGAPGDLPPLPHWPEGWQLGQPDLVLEAPDGFVLSAEGRDVYHNFVLPVPLNERKYVVAMEFHSGSKAIHHAGMHLDATPESRLRDAKEPGPGFAGMELPATVIVPRPLTTM